MNLTAHKPTSLHVSYPLPLSYRQTPGTAKWLWKCKGPVTFPCVRIGHNDGEGAGCGSSSADSDNNDGSSFSMFQELYIISDLYPKKKEKNS